MNQQTRTIRRDWLKRQIEQGKALARCKFALSDDYIDDNARNLGRTGWKPAYLKASRDDYREGMIGFLPEDFRYRSGRAYQYEDSQDITFVVMTNESFAIRIVEPSPKE